MRVKGKMNQSVAGRHATHEPMENGGGEAFPLLLGERAELGRNSQEGFTQ
jgi:hypothetical protein